MFLKFLIVELFATERGKKRKDNKRKYLKVSAIVLIFDFSSSDFSLIVSPNLLGIIVFD